MDYNARQNIDLLFEKFENFLKEKTVIGEPIELGNVTMIPALTVSFGLGDAGGDGNDAKGMKGTGSSGGVAARIAPTALIVVKGDEVEVLPISKGYAFERIASMVPDLIDKLDIKEKMESRKKEE